MVKRIPNGLTVLRLLLIPFFVFLMHEPSRAAIDTAIVIFVLAAITDLLDGMIARKYRAESNLGRLLDPLADKILVMAALVMLVAMRSDGTGEGWVPGWMVVIILAREIWVTGLRGLAATRGLVVPAGESGKLKSVLQMVAIVFLLLHDRMISLLFFSVSTQYIGLNLLFISLFFSVWGAVEYTVLVVKAE